MTKINDCEETSKTVKKQAMSKCFIVVSMPKKL